MVDVGHVERIAVQRQDRWTLVDVDVLDTELLCVRQITFRPRIMQLVAPALAAPLGGVELHTLNFIFLDKRFERIEPSFAVTRVEGAIEDEAVWIPRLEDRILLGGVETLFVKVGQHGRLEDRHVVRAVQEEVTIHGLGVVFVELVPLPHLVFRAERCVVAVETGNELLAVHVALVLAAAVPQMHMAVYDEDFLSIFRLIHSLGSLDVGRTSRRPPNLPGTAAWLYSYRNGYFILLVSERVFHVA